MLHPWKYIIEEQNVLPTSIPNNLVWIDFTDKSNLYQNIAGTTPVTTIGQAIMVAKNLGNDGSTYDAISVFNDTIPIYTTGSGGFGARLDNRRFYSLRNIVPISGSAPRTFVISVSDLTYTNSNAGYSSVKCLVSHGYLSAYGTTPVYGISSHFNNTSSVQTLGMLYETNNTSNYLIVSNSLTDEYNRDKYCVSARYNGTSNVLYANGKFQFQHTIVLNTATTGSVGTHLGIVLGNSADGFSPFVLHQIAIYNRYLSDDEVGAVHKWFMKKSSVGG